MTKMAIDEFADGFYDNLSEGERRLLGIISVNPEMIVATIAEMMNVSDRTVKRYISALIGKGIIRRVGSDKTGHWEII